MSKDWSLPVTQFACVIRNLFAINLIWILRFCWYLHLPAYKDTHTVEWRTEPTTSPPSSRLEQSIPKK